MLKRITNGSMRHVTLCPKIADLKARAHTQFTSKVGKTNVFFFFIALDKQNITYSLFEYFHHHYAMRAQCVIVCPIGYA